MFGQRLDVAVTHVQGLYLCGFLLFPGFKDFICCCEGVIRLQQATAVWVRKWAPALRLRPGSTPSAIGSSREAGTANWASAYCCPGSMAGAAAAAVQPPAVRQPAAVPQWALGCYVSVSGGPALASTGLAKALGSHAFLGACDKGVAEAPLTEYHQAISDNSPHYPCTLRPGPMELKRMCPSLMLASIAHYC